MSHMELKHLQLANRSPPSNDSGTSSNFYIENIDISVRSTDIAVPVLSSLCRHSTLCRGYLQT